MGMAGAAVIVDAGKMRLRNAEHLAVERPLARHALPSPQRPDMRSLSCRTLTQGRKDEVYALLGFRRRTLRGQRAVRRRCEVPNPHYPPTALRPPEQPSWPPRP